MMMMIMMMMEIAVSPAMLMLWPDFQDQVPICKAASGSKQYSFYYSRERRKRVTHILAMGELLAVLHQLERGGPRGEGGNMSPQLLGHCLSWVSQAS